MQSLRETLQYLSSTQGAELDGCRIFASGKIHVRTPTAHGGEGWMEIAGPISGSGPMFGHFFDGEPTRFLKARDLRQAIDIRDRMMVEVTQDRTIRNMKKMVRKEVLKKMRTKTKRLVPDLHKEEKQENQNREPTTLFL